jgi:Fe2+ transport system protein FeoA
VLKHRDLRPLHTFQAGQRVLIREVQDDSPERLRRWHALGLVPGATVAFVRHHPLDGVFVVRVGKRVCSLASEGLAGLLGEPLP